MLPASVDDLAARLAAPRNDSLQFPQARTTISAAARTKTFGKVFNCNAPATPMSSGAALQAFDDFAGGIGRTNSAQHRLTGIVHSAEYDALLSGFYSQEMSQEALSRAAHFQSASCSDAVAWATCVPSEAEFRIPAEEYRWLLAHHFLQSSEAKSP